jgi:hypothetical protein
MTTTVVWPQKTGALHKHHFDSTIWNAFQFRHDDIIITAYAQSDQKQRRIMAVSQWECAPVRRRG